LITDWVNGQKFGRGITQKYIDQIWVSFHPVVMKKIFKDFKFKIFKSLGGHLRC